MCVGSSPNAYRVPLSRTTRLSCPGNAPLPSVPPLRASRRRSYSAKPHVSAIAATMEYARIRTRFQNPQRPTRPVGNSVSSHPCVLQNRPLRSTSAVSCFFDKSPAGSRAFCCVVWLRLRASLRLTCAISIGKIRGWRARPVSSRATRTVLGRLRWARRCIWWKAGTGCTFRDPTFARSSQRQAWTRNIRLQCVSRIDCRWLTGPKRSSNSPLRRAGA